VYQTLYISSMQGEGQIRKLPWLYFDFDVQLPRTRVQHRTISLIAQTVSQLLITTIFARARRICICGDGPLSAGRDFLFSECIHGLCRPDSRKRYAYRSFERVSIEGRTSVAFPPKLSSIGLPCRWPWAVRVRVRLAQVYGVGKAGIPLKSFWLLGVITVS